MTAEENLCPPELKENQRLLKEAIDRYDYVEAQRLSEKCVRMALDYLRERGIRSVMMADEVMRITRER